MPILWTFDLAARTGFAFGEVGGRPEIGVRIFHRTGQPPETAAAELGCFLRDRLAAGPRPALIGVERYLPPVAQKSADATKIAQQMRGALEAVASCYRVTVLDASVDTVRKHFCGVSSAHARTRRRPETTDREHAKMRAESRDATKSMVIARAIQLGYLPRGCDDADRADAAALFDLFQATEFRVRPTLALTSR